MRGILAAVCCAVGAASGVAAVAIHSASWWWFALAVGAPVLTCISLPSGVRRLGYALGFVAPILTAMVRESASEYLIAASPRGYGLLAGALVVLLIGVATIPRPAPSLNRSGAVVAAPDEAEPASPTRSAPAES